MGLGQRQQTGEPPRRSPAPRRPAKARSACVRLALCLATTLSLAACPLRFVPCDPDRCPAGQECSTAGECQVADALPDGGTAQRDGGLDAGEPPLPLDASTATDGGKAPEDDAGPNADAGLPGDGGIADGGRADAGPADAGPIDAGLLLCTEDDDGDGYGEDCPLGPDCNDGDPTRFHALVLFADGDGDGIGSGPVVEEGCFGLDIPANRSPLNTDCEPTDGDRFRWLDVFPDFDQDGQATLARRPVCVGAELPPGFRETAPVSGERDCDDLDARRGQGQQELCDGTDNNCDGVIDEGEVCAATGCTRVVEPESGDVYLHCTSASNYFVQRDRCEALGYVPASLETHTEFNFASTLAELSDENLYTINGSTRSLYVGLTDLQSEGVFRWESGHPFSAGAFVGPDNPDNFANEDCVELYAYNRGLNDNNCAGQRPILCEPGPAPDLAALSWPPYSPPAAGDCLDDDGDGFGDGCALGRDCDDTDQQRFRFYFGYADRDGDGVFEGQLSNVCGGAFAPQALRADRPPVVDCDDGDVTIGGEVTRFIDSDGDGVPAAEPILYNCAIELPPESAKDAPPVFDCQANDPAIFPGQAEACDGVDNDCDGDVDENACFCETRQFDGKGYLFCDARFGVTTAEAAAEFAGTEEAIDRCAAQGNRVPAFPNTIEENLFLQSNLDDTIASAWLGLFFDTGSGEWRDVDGNTIDDETAPSLPLPLPFELWGPNEPTPGAGQPCAIFREDTGFWFDVSCSLENVATVCESPTP